ncbi:hypothetical protein Salat_0696900 [Sesamum alatum]|uniref:Endonuclease/exonuclease/phosphatase domain-containing protein n=1 Tax=Sesamum alatum TaxID=300844 RepID=A0AAE2CUU8_9LAMI|nr:hypothetical protein Salat_0696900 [Sesamum alatum]
MKFSDQRKRKAFVTYRSNRCKRFLRHLLIASFMILAIMVICSHGPTIGRTVFSFKQMQAFRETLVNFKLHDLGYNGDIFKWTNNRTYPNTIRERLDRACGSSTWIANFQNFRVQHLSTNISDHSPIFLGCCTVRNPESGKQATEI